MHTESIDTVRSHCSHCIVCWTFFEPRFGSWIEHAVEPLSAVAATLCEARMLLFKANSALPGMVCEGKGHALSSEALVEHHRVRSTRVFLSPFSRHHLSIEYSKLLKTVYVERAFGGLSVEHIWTSRLGRCLFFKASHLKHRLGMY